MEDFQKRMVKEYKELEEKTIKLKAFINNNPKYDKLDTQERVLQALQFGAMTRYMLALASRLRHQGINVDEL